MDVGAYVVDAKVLEFDEGSTLDHRTVVNDLDGAGSFQGQDDRQGPSSKRLFSSKMRNQYGNLNFARNGRGGRCLIRLAASQRSQNSPRTKLDHHDFLPCGKRRRRNKSDFHYGKKAEISQFFTMAEKSLRVPLKQIKVVVKILARVLEVIKGVMKVLE